jgi:hypothetical protein
MDNIFSGSSGRPGESEEIFGANQWAFGYSAVLQYLDVPPNPRFIAAMHLMVCSIYISIHR